MNANDYNPQSANCIQENLQVGSIQKLFGKNGQLVIKLWDNFPENTTEPLWVELDALAVPLFIASIQKQGDSKAVVIFDDYPNEKLASMLIGLKVYALSNTETENESNDPLRGFTVHDLTSGIEGTVVELMDNEYNPLIEIQRTDNGQRALIPWTEAFLKKKDQRKKHITLELPEGIFDL